MEKKLSISGEFIVTIANNGSVTVYKKCPNTTEGLREAAKAAGYTEDPKANGWNTRTYGRKLVDYVEKAEVSKTDDR